MATHSEVLLHEAAGDDTVIAFVGEPHRIGGTASQVRKALSLIGWEQYYLAEQTGWVLYLENSTDLDILRAFARRLGHRRAMAALEKPFFKAVYDQPRKAQEHFHALREAYGELRAVALFDRLPGLPQDDHIAFLMWQRREIENYLCSPATLEAFARDTELPDSLGPIFRDNAVRSMRKIIARMESALADLGRPSPWGSDLKVSDDFLVPLFKSYFEELGLYNTMPKGEFHRLVDYVPDDVIDKEVTEKLDAIAEVATIGEG